MEDNRLVRFMKGWRDVTRVLEATLVDNVSATLPWFAPTIAAWLAYFKMSTILEFPIWLSATGGLVIEGLGLVTVSTVFKLWDYNQSKGKSQRKSPVFVAIGVSAFYLIIVLTVNVILGDEPVIHKVAESLLTSLSIPGAITLALRSNHERMLQEHEKERAERKAERSGKKTARSVQVTASPAATYTVSKPDWRKLPQEERELVARLTVPELQERYGLNERSAYNWKARVKDE